MDAVYRGSTLSHDLTFANRSLPPTYAFASHEQPNPISQSGVIENQHSQIIVSNSFANVGDATLRQLSQLSRNDSTSLSQPSLYLVAEAPPDPPSIYSSSTSLAPPAAAPIGNTPESVLLVTPPKPQSSLCSPGTLSTASVLQQMKQGTYGNSFLSSTSSALQSVQSAGETLAFSRSLESGAVSGGSRDRESVSLNSPGVAAPSALLVSEFSREGAHMAGPRGGEIGDEDRDEGADGDEDNAEDEDGGADFDDDSASNSPSTASNSKGGSGLGQPGSPTGASAVHKKRRYKEFAVESEGHYVCRVCGDRALGYNFDAITCESCKAFFRRNATKNKVLKCNFDGACKIDAQTRKFCPGCRLEKCYEAGMRREWILSEDQLAMRRQKTRTNRMKKQQVAQQKYIEMQLLHHALGSASMPAAPLTDASISVTNADSESSGQQYSQPDLPPDSASRAPLNTVIKNERFDLLDANAQELKPAFFQEQHLLPSGADPNAFLACPPAQHCFPNLQLPLNQPAGAPDALFNGAGGGSACDPRQAAGAPPLPLGMQMPLSNGPQPINPLLAQMGLRQHMNTLITSAINSAANMPPMMLAPGMQMPPLPAFVQPHLRPPFLPPPYAAAQQQQQLQLQQAASSLAAQLNGQPLDDSSDALFVAPKVRHTSGPSGLQGSISESNLTQSQSMGPPDALQHTFLAPDLPTPHDATRMRLGATWSSCGSVPGLLITTDPQADAYRLKLSNSLSTSNLPDRNDCNDPSKRAAPLRNALTPGPYGGASSQQLAAASMEWVVGFSPLNENDHSTLLWFSRLLSQLFDAPPLESPAGVSNGGGGGTDNAGGEQALVYVECVPDLQTFLRLADMFIRRFIKFCKCLPEFSALHQDDQIRLLKAGVMEAIVLRGPMEFDAQRRGWLFRTAPTSSEVLVVPLESLRTGLLASDALYLQQQNAGLSESLTASGSLTDLHQLALSRQRSEQTLQSQARADFSFPTDANEASSAPKLQRFESSNPLGSSSSLVGPQLGGGGAGAECYAEFEALQTRLLQLTACTTGARESGEAAASPCGAYHARLACLLLFVVELFSPDRAGLSGSCRAQVSLAQERYLILLKRYLEARCEHERARSLLPALLSALGDVRRLAEHLTRLAMRIDWSNVEPLLMEMFGNNYMSSATGVGLSTA